ncbi:zinc finger CCCH-type with G patch domain-containing protein isoform X2 [Chelonus insularis]|uniref:zinc finger CCCH-type with G patch domain-containing protein isoform X2 n=1 Tax=Chelonus insularis TaxID=460826 RepID=UPI00158D2193|nr:zinc finger CCCH-type with G patch domain-containing protein isoform X2 [Chelonus insularis]
MTDVKKLQEAIEQYETQLSQVQLALSSAVEGHNRDNLLSLQSDIQELIALTKESLKSAEEGKESSDNEDDGLSDDGQIEDDDDPLTKQCAMFKAELEDDESQDNDENDKQEAANSNNIEDELKTLEGMKCRAPHGSSWGGTSFHNAMVSSVLTNNDKNISSINDIMIRVFFINPTHKEMLPCSYFLDGVCKFSDDKCHYSHGEIVPFSALEEYKEPDYSTIKMGSRVLAKDTNKIWHRSVILQVPDSNEEFYRVKFEASGKIMEVYLYDIVPLQDNELEMSDSSDDSNKSDTNNMIDETKKRDVIQKSLLHMNSSEPLGNWERHTRGMGSKLMARMGYVVGTGLGKRSDGRVIPIEATVLPAGKSLDHCMELRLNAGGDEDLYSVEKRMKKERLKLEKKQQKQYEREKNRNSTVFNFINDTLGIENLKPGSSKMKTNLKGESTRDLNVANFRVGEDILRLERESLKLMNSLGKYSKGSLPYNNIIIQYNEKQNELLHLRSKQKNIITEQSHRKDKAKLSVF